VLKTVDVPCKLEVFRAVVAPATAGVSVMHPAITSDLLQLLELEMDWNRMGWLVLLVLIKLNNHTKCLS
jgi:hypothetical protein